jgi:molybdopterin synthase catalytic subunit
LPEVEVTRVEEVRSTPRIWAAVVESEIDAHGFTDSSLPATAGASVIFVGIVRDHDHGRRVNLLEYTAHPSAVEVLTRAAERILSAHPGVLGIRVVHRIGVLRIGDCALLAEVWAPHRRDAFVACSDLVEEVKQVLPVWKRQVFTDGTEEWVNSP